MSFNLESVKSAVTTFVEKYPVVNGPLTTVAEKAKIEKPYVVLLAALIPILLVFMMGAGEIIIDLIGFVYPLYASIKAIESQDKEDDRLFLSYWIIFCLFKIIEGVAGFIVSFIPFYFIGKLAFLIWCYYPSTKGAEIVYNAVIKTYIVPNLGFAKQD
jgi:receptor expression-enhancing protein 5/6